MKLAELFVVIRGDSTPLNRTLDSARSALLGFAGKAGAMKFNLNPAALGLSAVGVAAGAMVKEAISLEHQFGQIRKTTGLAAGDMAVLKGRLEELSTTMAGVSLEEVTGIAAMAGRLGIQGVEGITAYTKAVAMIRVALDDIPAEEAATSIARLLNVFKLGPDAAMSLASALNKLDDSTTATGRDILDVAQRLSGAGATLGMTPQAVLALAATLKDAGIETEVAGSSFSQVLMKMATDTDKFAKAAGVPAREFADTLRRDPLEAIKALVAGLGGLEKLEQFKALDGLGLDGVRTAGSLMQLKQVIGKLDGAVADANSEWRTHASIQKEVDLRASETGAQLQRLWNNLKLVGGGLGSLVLPAIRDASTLFAEMATTLRANFGAIQERVAPVLATFHEGVESLGVVFRNFGDVVALAGLNIEESLDKAGAKFDAFVANAKVGAGQVARIFNALKNGGGPMGFDPAAFGKNLVQQMVPALLGGGDLDGGKLFAAGAGVDPDNLPGKPRPDFAKMREEIEEKIRKREEERNKPKEAKELVGPPKPGGDAKEGNGKAPAKGKKGGDREPFEPEKDEAPEKRAKHEDLVEFAKSFQEGIFNGKDDANKKMAANLEKLVEYAKKQLAKAENGQANVAVGPG